ncbi:hypothetical protein AWZ03_005104 [Drosophila navojoa]|uniref:Uncharacterized protein n=1 Tax=Drosophila navojoa TaxID=7232 RepID=A0A484BKJ5_DRONA|nr:hypothetical protein AWZ03_005104 [Drosophila navojoa]
MPLLATIDVDGAGDGDGEGDGYGDGDVPSQPASHPTDRHFNRATFDEDNNDNEQRATGNEDDCHEKITFSPEKHSTRRHFPLAVATPTESGLCRPPAWRKTAVR